MTSATLWIPWFAPISSSRKKKKQQELAGASG